MMDLSLIAGSANRPLASAVAACLGVKLMLPEVRQFPDGEQHVQLRASVRGADVYILQPTSPPVDKHFIELLFLSDAARRAGAERITAVVPYVGYARQDRRAHGREALAARLTADMLQTARVDRVVSIDVHGHAMEGFFPVPFDHLSAVQLLLQELVRLGVPDSGIVVAPDLGAVKLAERYAKELDLPVAILRKTRLSGAEVAVTGVIGNVQDRVPIIVDDMISTGATIRAAADALSSAGARLGATVVATHGLFVGDAADRLCGKWLERVIVSDTVSVHANTHLPVHTVSVADLLSQAIERLYRGESLSGLVAYE
jgi:ribose-phosphate pyrophosphokinase